MRSASAAAIAELGSDVVHGCFGIRILRPDGVIIRAIEHDRTLPLDIGVGAGSESFSAALGFTRSAYQSDMGFKADNFEIKAFLTAAGITQADVRAGRYDGAKVWVFLCLWADLSIPIIEISAGDMGQVSADDSLDMEVRTLLGRFGQTVGRTAERFCDVDLGSARCGVDIDPPAWVAATAYANIGLDALDGIGRDVVKLAGTPDRFLEVALGGDGTSHATTEPVPGAVGGTIVDGTVTWNIVQARRITDTVATSVDRKTLTLTTGSDAPDGFFKNGYVQFTSGDNSGKALPIETWTQSTGTVVLQRPMPFDMAATDALVLVAGCEKIKTGVLGMGCAEYFNIWNYQGFDGMTGDEKLLGLSRT